MSINNDTYQYLSTVENERRKKAKEATIVRKLEKTTKDNDKYALGYAVLENSDGGNKRKRSSYEDDNTEDDSDNGAMSATYRIENKIPVVCPSDVTSSSKSSKRRASPPKQSRILSLQEVKAMYPNLTLHDEEDDDQDIIAPIKRKVSSLRLISLFAVYKNSNKQPLNKSRRPKQLRKQRHLPIALLDHGHPHPMVWLAYSQI